MMRCSLVLAGATGATVGMYLGETPHELLPVVAVVYAALGIMLLMVSVFVEK